MNNEIFCDIESNLNYLGFERIYNKKGFVIFSNKENDKIIIEFKERDE